MKTSEMLKAAKARIQDPNNWCQKTFATNRAGLRRGLGDRDAEKFCAIGALEVGARPYGDTEQAMIALTRAALSMGRCCITEVNDCDGHPDVMRMYDLAITETEKAEQ